MNNEDDRNDGGVLMGREKSEEVAMRRSDARNGFV